MYQYKECISIRKIYNIYELEQQHDWNTITETL